VFSTKRVLRCGMAVKNERKVGHQTGKANEMTSYHQTPMRPMGNPMIFHRYPLEQALRIMAKFGYRELELWPPQIEACRTDELRKQLAEHAAALGLSLVRLNAAAAPYFDTPLSSPGQVPGIIEGLKRDIDVACSLGMSQLLSWEGRKPATSTKADVHGWILDETVRIFREATQYGASKGVSLSIEVHPFTLGIDLEFLIELCDAIDSDSFGVTYDCCHFGVGFPAGYIEAISKLGYRIKHVHFSDSDQNSSELHFAIGKGCLDLDGIIAALKKIEFSGTIMLDLWLYPFPEEGTKISLPYVARAMKAIGSANSMHPSRKAGTSERARKSAR
jgi:sugar phosphate isomerase/epimerase